MINFRVDDLPTRITRLHAAGIAVETRPELDGERDGEGGSFARIHDPEANPIVPWQEPAPAA